MKSSAVPLAALFFTWTTILSAQEAPPRLVAEKPNAKDAIKEIAGSAEFLRGVPKKFGTLRGVDAGKRQVTVLFEGDKDSTTWTLTPDAEIKVWGWWGRLDDLSSGVEERVWAGIEFFDCIFAEDINSSDQRHVASVGSNLSS